VWHWIEEDGERSLQVRPLLKGKIWTLNESDDDANMMITSLCAMYNIIYRPRAVDILISVLRWQPSIAQWHVH